MIKINDETYNIAKPVKCFVIKLHLPFFKEVKVAINENKHIGYLKIFIHHLYVCVCVCVCVYKTVRETRYVNYIVWIAKMQFQHSKRK